MSDEQQQEEHYTHNLREIFSDDFTFTKRQIGIFMLVSGVVGIVGILAIDILNAGREGGIGPAQQLALFIMLAVALVGLSLIPLGDRPA